MNRLLGLFVSLFLVVGGAACSSDDDSPDRDDAGSGADRSDTLCDPAMDDAFAAWGEAGFSGSIAVSTGGEDDCLAAYGIADRADDTPNTVDTVFSIGSITKAFTAAAVLELVDEGKLALDARAGDLVDGLGGPAADVTVDQLLLHTSGLTGSHGEDYVALDRSEAIAALGGLELALAPGSDFLYSNSGYTLLALIVEEASGTTYRDYVTSQLLDVPDGAVAAGFANGEPAAPGPRAVGYLDDGSPGDGEGFAGPHWAVEGNGGVAMTTRDLARWADALFAGQLISAEATETLRTLRFDNGDGSAEIPGWVAFDQELFGEPAYAAAGGGGDGHNAVVAVLPESQRVITIASNTADVTAEDLLQAVGPALAADEPVPGPETPSAAVDPAAIEAVAGRYGLDSGGTFEVGAQDDRLAIAATGADAVDVLFPLPDDYTADDAAGHEQGVLDLLAGETQAGREERAAIEADFGAIDDVTLVGTIVRDFELRTYVTVTSGTDSTLFWYALDDEGGVAAVELGTDPPTLLLVASGDGAYVPDDPTGAAPELTVTFAEDGMALAGPAGRVTAARLG